MAKYQFASKLMFAIVMHDAQACKQFIEMVFPEKKVEKIRFPEMPDGEAGTMREYVVEVEKTILTGINSKSVRLDVLFEGDERVYDIEMQLQKEDEVPKRSRYYHMAIARNSLKVGETYDKLKTGYVIFVCCFDPFEKGEPMYRFEMFDKKLQLQLGDGSSTIILNTKCPKVAVPEELEAFFNFVNTGEVDENDDFVTYLGSRLEEASEDEEVDRIMTIEEEMRFQRAMAEKREKQAYADGEKTGAEQRTQEIAKNFKTAGIPLDVIAENTGLSVEDIQKL